MNNAAGADLFICEGMYGDREKETNARQHKHMMFYEAAELAKEAGVKEMWLTHFSPSLVAPKRYMKDVNSIYSKVSLGYDGRMKTLDFVD